MVILITDEFDDMEHNYAPHNIVYGADGWTDQLDDETIRTLVFIGAIQLVDTYVGIGWSTHIYVSKEGNTG